MFILIILLTNAYGCSQQKTTNEQHSYGECG